MSLATTRTRPSRNLRAMQRLREDADHITHFRLHVELAMPRLEEPSGRFRDIPVTLGGPWKKSELDKIRDAWGIPQELDMHGSHFSEGGWRVFRIPPLPEVFAFAAKAAKHSEAVVYLELLASVVVRSQLTLSEAALVVLELVSLDPVASGHPRERANGWAAFGIVMIDLWESRHQSDGVGVGDVGALAERLGELRRIVGLWQVEQMEMDFERRRKELS